MSHDGFYSHSVLAEGLSFASVRAERLSSVSVDPDELRRTKHRDTMQEASVGDDLLGSRTAVLDVSMLATVNIPHFLKDWSLVLLVVMCLLHAQKRNDTDDCGWRRHIDHLCAAANLSADAFPSSTDQNTSTGPISPAISCHPAGAKRRRMFKHLVSLPGSSNGAVGRQAECQMSLDVAIDSWIICLSG